MNLTSLSVDEKRIEAQKHLLSKEQSSNIFKQILLPEILRKAKAMQVQRPEVVMLGGQPGAGKSGLQTDVTSEMKQKNGAIEIIGDDLRPYHPNYARLMLKDSQSAAFYTDLDTGRWVEMLIEEAQKQKLNVILEGTMRQPEVVANTAKSFKEAGYLVDARVLAVKPEVSWQSVHARYEEMLAKGDSPRFTQQATHDMAVNGLLTTLDKLEHEKLADKLSVFSRAGDTLYRNEIIQNEQGRDWVSEQGARQAVESEREREFTPEQRSEHRSRWQSILDKMTNRGANHDDIKKNEVRMTADNENFAKKENELTAIIPTRPISYEVSTKVAAKYLVVKNGEQSQFFDKKTPDVIAFEDKVTALKSAREDAATIAHMVDVATSKGWERLVLKGTESFRREAWLEANLKGLETKGYTPNDKDLAVLMAKQADRSSNQILDDTKSKDNKSVDTSFVKSETHHTTLHEQDTIGKPVAQSLSESEQAKVIILRRCLESSIQSQPENIASEKLSAFDSHIRKLTESGQISSYLANVEQPKTTDILQTEKVRDISSQDYDRDRGK